MPIFRKKNSKKGKNGENIPDPPKLTSQSSITDTTNAVQEVDVMDKPKSENQQILRRENSTKSNFEFKCQQAQGSPTKLIAGFSSIKELYVKIAQAYNFPPDEVRF